MTQERPLGGLLISVLFMNAALLVALVFERMQATTATRFQLAEMAIMGLACVVILRALKLSREMRSSLRKHVEMNRLLQ